MMMLFPSCVVSGEASAGAIRFVGRLVEDPATTSQ